jgi:riboflavin kinase/FMN adenylyltransferase
MLVHFGYEDINLLRPVVTLGIFDGVHRGHQALLTVLNSRSAETGGESCVITFQPHPRYVLKNDDQDMLSSIEEKKMLLSQAGIDHLIILDFNKEFSNTSACDFVRNVLIERIGARHLLIGYDHRFGKHGEGNFDTIRQCAGLDNFTVEQAEAVFSGGEPISSTSIRQALLKGDIEKANDYLGYYYTISGKVIEGKKIGRSFGFPTANILPGDKNKLIPALGVYAVEVGIDNRVFKGMLSIGTNPTVNNDASVRSIEVYILDFDEDIYGKEISIRFRKRLRDERKFGSIAELGAQMELDKLETIKILS